MNNTEVNNMTLTTPIYHKVSDDMVWPSDPVFFLVSKVGLFLCRNHPYFKSSVPAPRFPCELAEHQTTIKLSYPKIPRRLFELAVGFCTRIYQLHQSEAGLLLIYNVKTKRMHWHCPPQQATVSQGKYGTWPIGLHYEIPPLGPDEVLLGDLHSHGDEAAYHSGTDNTDTATAAGTIHLVVGRCGDVLIGKQPDLYIELVIDGTRFKLPWHHVIEGYSKARMKVPQAWIDQVEVQAYTSSPYYEAK